VDDVIFAHNRPGSGDASRASIQSDSKLEQHGSDSVAYTETDSPVSIAEAAAEFDVHDCLNRSVLQRPSSWG